MKGRVVKGVGGSYQVSDGVCSLECSPRGRLKREDRLAVGDWVEVSSGRRGRSSSASIHAGMRSSGLSLPMSIRCFCWSLRRPWQTCC